MTALRGDRFHIFVWACVCFLISSAGLGLRVYLRRTAGCDWGGECSLTVHCTLDITLSPEWAFMFSIFSCLSWFAQRRAKWYREIYLIVIILTTVVIVDSIVIISNESNCRPVFVVYIANKTWPCCPREQTYLISTSTWRHFCWKKDWFR